MKIEKNIAWVFYYNNIPKFDKNKVGKWMYFFDNRDIASKICEKSVQENIVEESKHSNADKGVACFYIHSDDIEAHKRVLSFFLENNLIKRTKNGRLYNIAFKLDNQTKAGEYGSDFHSNIKLSNFIDLNTGEWII